MDPKLQYYKAIRIWFGNPDRQSNTAIWYGTTGRMLKAGLDSTSDQQAKLAQVDEFVAKEQYADAGAILWQVITEVSQTELELYGQTCQMFLEAHLSDNTLTVRRICELLSYSCPESGMTLGSRVAFAFEAFTLVQEQNRTKKVKKQPKSNDSKKLRQPVEPAYFEPIKSRNKRGRRHRHILSGRGHRGKGSAAAKRRVRGVVSHARNLEFNLD